MKSCARAALPIRVRRGADPTLPRTRRPEAECRRSGRPVLGKGGGVAGGRPAGEARTTPIRAPGGANDSSGSDLPARPLGANMTEYHPPPVLPRSTLPPVAKSVSPTYGEMTGRRRASFFA